jgi:hypothetical protein
MAFVAAPYKMVRSIGAYLSSDSEEDSKDEPTARSSPTDQRGFNFGGGW